MNPWFVFIIAVIIVHYLLELTVSLLQIRALSPQLPDEFSDIFDEKKYLESQGYTKATTKFSLVENSFSTLVTIIFLVAGGFNLVDQYARSFGFGSIITGLIFCGLLMLLSFIAGLPFSAYSTFILEAKFGFNRTTVRTYVLDIVKGIFLAIMLGTPILSLILWFFENSGPLAWIYCWAGVVVFSIILQFLAPVLIMPMFNKFTPLAEGALREKIQAYADHQRFKIQGIFTMDGSKRSSKLNAFFTGFGKFRKIVFFDTLVEKLTDDEIVAVLAHEMGHFKKKHIWKMLGASVIQTGLIFFMLSLFINNTGLFQAFGMEHPSIYASIVFFVFIYQPLSTLLSIAFNYVSRKHEFEADAYAAETTQRADMLILGLKKLSRENLSNLTPHPLMVFLSYSHPPVLERIRALSGCCR